MEGVSEDCQLCPARVPSQLCSSLRWGPGQALVAVPPCRVLPHPPSRYLHPRPQRKVQSKPHSACEFVGSFACLAAPLCLQVTRCA